MTARHHTSVAAEIAAERAQAHVMTVLWVADYLRKTGRPEIADEIEAEFTEDVNVAEGRE